MEALETHPKWVIAVYPPIPRRQLYPICQGRDGVVIVRMADEVLALVQSRNSYFATARLFQRGGILAQYEVHRAYFEFVASNGDRKIIRDVLHCHLCPIANTKQPRLLGVSSATIQSIVRQYEAQTRFSTPGHHLSDSFCPT